MRKGQVETSELGTTAHLGCIEFRPQEEGEYTNQILIPLVGDALIFMGGSLLLCGLLVALS